VPKPADPDPWRDALVSFGRTLRDLRDDANLTQQALAGRIGRSNRTLSDLERGKGERVPAEDFVIDYIDECLKKWQVDEVKQDARRAHLLRAHHLLDELRELLRRSRGDGQTMAINEGFGSIRKLPVDTGVFVGRAHELARLDEATADSGRVVVAAVHGLGGVGKSTLAARFAETRADRFAPVWWVTADSDTALDSGLADLASALNPKTAELPSDQRVELAIGWLASHPGWLVILDNLTVPRDAARLLERVRTGTIIITSRYDTGWQHFTTLPLDVLTPDEARELLGRIIQAGESEADLSDADRLCKELGCLPLALEQAGAYIAQTRSTPTAYLDLLKRYPARMFTATAEGGDAQRTMARVWHVTLDRLTSTPLAGQLLRQLAWYAPDNIPRHLITTNTDAPEPDTLDALGKLAAYSMITLDTNSISVHRLVQAVTRTPDPDDPHHHPDKITYARDATAEILADAIEGADHRLPANWPVFQAVLPHGRALLDHTDPGNDTETLCALANNLSLYVNEQGDPTTAIALADRATHSFEQLYGLDHPATLTSRNNLAGLYDSAGDLGRAIPLYEATLTDRERVLGPDHLATLTSRNNLAAAYRAEGDLARAIPLFEATLTDCERVLGLDHPDTLQSRNNLAYVYESAGDLGRAIPLFERTLTDYERVLGPDDPHTMWSRNSLAYVYESAGDLGRAIPLYEATLADRERVLGPDHPDTLSSRNDLANAYGAAGDLKRAIPLHEATLADRKRVLGPDHPDTLSSRNNLGVAHWTAGDLESATPLFETNLVDSERVLGPDNPSTLQSRNNLAYVYKLAGDLGRAVPLFEANLADRLRVLGPDHPHTLRSRNDLANAYQAAGDLERAIPQFEANLADRERVLGPDHPNTLRSQKDLANAYRAAGDLERAIPLYEANLAAHERMLGPDHSDTLSSRNDLANAYGAAGELERAIPLHEAVLADRERVLRPDHLDTLISRHNLACVYQEASDLTRALTLFETTLVDAERVLGTDHHLTVQIRSALSRIISSAD
jgi:tetratricopeptide (TPR) repeat protein/transcriptional regulator with XRE-family HTH domain